MTIDSAEEHYSQIDDDMGVGLDPGSGEGGSWIGVKLGGKREGYSLGGSMGYMF